MKDTELKRLRDADLYRVYVKAIREHTFSSTYEAADFARKQPARQFYLSVKTASNLISMIRRGLPLDRLNELSRKRALCLYERYTAFLAENPDSGLTTSRIIEAIVDEPAPEFYLSKERAKHIIVYERRRVRRRLGCYEL